MGIHVTKAELATENAALKTELSAVKAELAEIGKKYEWLLEQLSGARRKLFGQSSEKGAYDGLAAQTRLYPDGAVAVAHGGPAGGAAGGLAQPRQRPRKRGELISRLPKDLPVEVVEVALPDGGASLAADGGSARAIGRELARRELKITPAKGTIVEYWRTSYEVRPAGWKVGDAPTIAKAPMPPQTVAGSALAPETIAHVITQKCVMGTPLYRQEQEFKRNGIPLDRQTMAKLAIRCSEDYFGPVYDELHGRLLRHGFLHSDGTPFQVLNEPGRAPQSQSQMWVYRTSGDAERPIVLYDYQTDKTQARPRDFLEGFEGYLVTDGSSSYRGLPDRVVLAGCLAHARRGFHDALMAVPADKREGSLALAGMGFCDELFRIERGIDGLDHEGRRAARERLSGPVLGEFRAWLDSVQPHTGGKSAIGKAVGYAANQWEYLTRFMLDGRIEISNNRCERSIKPFVINRKNFLFASSVAGARATAVLHSMTETAKENGLNPYEYLAHVLRTAAGRDPRGDAALLEGILPWNAPDSCRVTR